MKNRMVKQKRLWVGSLSLVLAVLLLVTACAPPTTLPRGEKVVEIGDIPLLTGGGSTADQPCFQAIQDYVTYFNEVKGIPGVIIEIVWRDCATDTGRFLSVYRMLVDRGVPVIFSNYPTPLQGLKPELEKDQLPVVTGGATGPVVYPPGWVFSAWATQGETATAVLDYFMQNWREGRPPRLQFFVSDLPVGREPAAEGTRYAQSVGFEVLPLEVSPLVVIDATTQLLRIHEREADLVYVWNIISAGGPIMRDVERLGLQDKMQFAGTEWILGKPLINMAPVSVEGFLAPKGLPWFDETEIPGVKRVVDSQMRYHGEVQENPEYMAGWVYGAIVCEAVRRAVGEVGYENIDGPAVKGALERMEDFDVDGMAKITYGPENRRGSRYCAVYQVQGGKIVRVTDWREVPILVPAG